MIVVVATLFLSDPQLSGAFEAKKLTKLMTFLPLLVAGPLVNAVCEELLYRHALIGVARPVIGTTSAVLGWCSIFSVGHITGNPSGLTGALFTFAYGLVCSIAMLQNKETAWNTTIHFFRDLSAVCALTLTTL